MAQWGGPCTESPQASHPGSLWGVLPRAFDLPLGTGKGCVFLQVYSLLVYLLYLLSLLWLEDQHVDVQQDRSPGVSPFATWKSGNRHIFLSSPKQIREGRRGLFQKKGAEILVPGSVVRTPCWSSGPAQMARAPSQRVFLVYKEAQARFLTPKAGLNLELHLPPGGSPVASLYWEGTPLPCLDSNLHPAFPIGWPASAQK